VNKIDQPEPRARRIRGSAQRTAASRRADRARGMRLKGWWHACRGRAPLRRRRGGRRASWALTSAELAREPPRRRRRVVVSACRDDA
jgi:hypothetical protein